MLFTVRDGVIVRDERIYDSAGLMERLEKARVDKELRTAAEVQRELSPSHGRVASFYESIGDSLHDRDMLVMFTDRVTEARNAADQEFGDQRLLECLTPAPAPADLLSRVLAAVRDFSGPAEPTDDITLLVTRYLAPGG
jgi:hypothetical protein